MTPTTNLTAFWIDPLLFTWGFGFLGLISLTLLLKQRKLNLKRLARVETGASYSLSYVMSMPLLAMFLLLIVQCTLLLMAKIGVVYASYAAARSVAVWSSAQTASNRTPGGQMDAKARQAAILAMVPFASGSKEHLSSGGGGGSQWIGAYQAAVREFETSQSISDDYLSTKLRNAAAGVRDVEVIRSPDHNGGLIEVTVRYEAPYLFGWLGRIMGNGSRGGVYYHLIESTVAFPCEDPRDGGRDIGIEYLSD